MNLNLRPANECKYDAVSLGEVMLRLDPGEGRIRTARSFRAWEGGGEYNVVRGLRRCFGLNTGVITAFADNEVGMLMEDFILQGGVDTSLIKWMKTDGIGRICRNGINFTERGFGIRGAVGCSDRANTAISKASRKQDRHAERVDSEQAAAVCTACGGYRCAGAAVQRGGLAMVGIGVPCLPLQLHLPNYHAGVSDQFVVYRAVDFDCTSVV